MDKYKWLPLSSVLKYENEIIKNNVSVVARSKDGFLYNYKKYKTANNMKNKKVPNENIDWNTKRNAFLARSIQQYKSNPTYRRWLSLVAWSYYIKPIH